MEKIKSFKQLRIWQKGIEIVNWPFAHFDYETLFNSL